jgi:hypothetical protein
VRYNPAMCRNIRTLHHFEPPSTPEEIRAAALQYVRKVSGLPKPPRDGEAVFERAIEQVFEATTKLLATLPARGEPRTREHEREKAQQRWAKREQRMRRS